MAIVECGFGHVAPGHNPADTLVHVGPSLAVDVGHPPGADGSVPVGMPSAVQVPALIDTGASLSCIDEQLAQDLKLPLINQENSSGVGGQVTLNVYLAHIAIPALGITQYGQFIGALLSEGGQVHKALLGRSLLKDTILIYDGMSGCVRLAH